MFAALTPVMMTNARAHPSTVLVATDASDDALASVEAPIGQALHRELWRIRDRRGWPTHLLGRHGEWLRFGMQLVVVHRGCLHTWWNCRRLRRND